ncbi:MAG: hypothetical protein EXX96DRAFT_387081 [Benjaminiella poitrasii]|nr:MAG: hypothetical protein EXX96DRAFT_387081 [Benjaminiella poitrasii]
MTSTNGNLKKHSNAKDLLNEEQQNVLERKGSKIERLQAEINQLSKPLLQSEEGEHKWSKHVTPNTLSVFQDEKSWDSINNLEIKRKSQVKDLKEVNGLSWNNMKESMHLESEDDSYSESESPVTTQLDAKDRGIFGTMPMEENIVVVKCNNCQRPLFPNKFKEHSDGYPSIETCIGSKKKNGANAKQKDFFSDDEEIDTKKDLKKKKKAVILEGKAHK